MANTGKGEFDLIVGDRRYVLTLGTAGLRALQNHFTEPGQPAADLGAVMERVMSASIDHIIVFLWACLRKYHPEMTLEAMPNWIDDAGGVFGLMEHIGELADTTAPDPQDVQELGAVKANPRKARAKRGTGANGSSRPGAVV